MSYRRRVLYSALTLATLVWSVTVAAAVTPGPQENISRTAANSEAPQAAVQGSTLAAVWGERDTTTIAVSQTTNGNAWPAPTMFVTGSLTKNQWPDIAITPDGATHIVYAAADSIYHQSKARGSATWSAPHLIVTDAFPNPVRMAAAPDSSIWTIWRDKNGTVIRYRRSTNGGVSWSGGDIATQVGNMFAPDLAVGPDSRPHAVWYLRSASGNTVRYADWNGSSWSVGAVTGSGYVADPVLTVDSNNVQHIAYRRQSGGNWIIQHATRVPGQAWGNEETVRTTPGDAGYPPSIAVERQGGVHVTWSELNAAGGRDVWYVVKQPGQAYSAPTNVSENPGGWNSRSTVVLTEDSVGVAAHIFFQRGVRGQDVDDIYYRRYLYGAPQPSLTGSLVLNDGAVVTNQPTVSARIANTSTTQATTYSIADGAAPGTPTTPFTHPTTTNFALNVADGQCRVHTVYAKLGNSTTTSPAFADSIVYDPSAQAQAEARNPNSPFNLPLNAMGSALVPGGDLAYTREERFNLSLFAGADECTGLTRFAIAPHDPARASTSGLTWRDVPAEGYVSANIQFAATKGVGTYQFDVYVEDMAGNITPPNAPNVIQIAYDPQPPMITGAPSVVPTTASATGGIVQLDLSSVTVSDNMFAGAGLGQQYWGVWVLVKRSADGAPTDVEWDSRGAIQPGTYSAALEWNMARGMVGSFQPGASYTVYLRFLDGAGNSSDTLHSAEVSVQRLEYRSFLPLVMR